jgi:hypothetical protein
MNNFNQQSYFAPMTSIRSTNNIIWVQGIEGAKAWQLAPNSMAILLDSENDGKMYIKVTDNIGMGSLRVFNYVEELVQPAQGNVTIDSSLDLSQYVKKDELSTLIKEIINEQPVSTVGVSEPAKPGVITIKK